MRKDPLAFLSAELDNLKQQGLYRKLRILESGQDSTAEFDGTKVVNLSSNNYLGLANHPKLVRAMVDATEKYGAGSGAGSRGLAGAPAAVRHGPRRIGNGAADAAACAGDLAGC